MNCPFCATGQAGLTRNMSTGEIVDQVVAGARTLRDGEIAGGARPGQQRRVHGHGRAAGQLQGASCGAVRRLRRPGAGRPRAVGARHHRVAPSGWCRRCDKLADEGLPVTLARLAARAGRRAARHAGAGQHPVEGRRGARRGAALLRGDRPAGQHRVRADPRHQRPGVAGRPARHRAQPARPRLGARQPDPAQPDAGLEVDGQRPRGRARRSSSGCARTASPPPSGTPAAARSTAPAASSQR